MCHAPQKVVRLASGGVIGSERSEQVPVLMGRVIVREAATEVAATAHAWLSHVPTPPSAEEEEEE